MGWARVLLLNACADSSSWSSSNGHAGQVWEPFTDAVIKVLNQKDTPVVFIFGVAMLVRRKLWLPIQSMHYRCPSGVIVGLSWFLAASLFQKLMPTLYLKANPQLIGWNKIESWKIMLLIKMVVL